jgi:5-methylcytosine-specific restriction endonuclease McrA
MKARETKIIDCTLYVSCSNCGQFKTLTGFTKEKRGALGIKSVCSDCRNPIQKEYRLKMKALRPKPTTRPKDVLWENGKGRYSGIATFANKRAKKTGQTNKLTAADVLRIHKIYDEMCINCGKREKLTIDHIIPFSKGGLNIVTNIQLLCHSCNSKKHTDNTDYRYEIINPS